MSEIDKYHKIYSNPNTSYGATNHGSPYISRILELAPRSMIDVGCGQNNLAITLRQHDIHVVGLDPAAPQADYRYPADNIPFPDNTFDLLTAFDVLEHLLPSNVKDALTEFRRVLKPTGVAVFTIANFSCTMGGKDELHPTRWPIERWRKVLESHLGTVTIIENAIHPRRNPDGSPRVLPNTYYVEVQL